MNIDRNDKKQWSRMKVIFFLSFAVGILAANLIGKTRLDHYGLLHLFFLDQYEYRPLDHRELMGYIMRIRIPVLMFLAIVGSSAFGWLVHLGYIAWNGFAFGFLCVAAISALGIKGIPILLTFLFPQYLIYIPDYLALVAVLMELGRKRDIGETGLYTRNRKYILFLGLFLLFLVFLVGIWVESYLNPFFVKKILKIF